MPWCPKCKAEFRAGFTVCNTCHIPLIEHEPDGTEQIEEPQYAEKWLNDNPKRTRLLRILRALAVLFVFLAIALLVAGKGI